MCLKRWVQGHQEIRAGPEFLLKVNLAQGVVQDAIAAEVIAVGAAGDQNDRHVLSIGSRNGIRNAQAADHESHHHCGYALRPCITISCISCSERNQISAIIVSVPKELSRCLRKSGAVRCQVMGAVPRIMRMPLYWSYRFTPWLVTIAVLCERHYLRL